MSEATPIARSNEEIMKILDLGQLPSHEETQRIIEATRGGTKEFEDLVGKLILCHGVAIMKGESIGKPLDHLLGRGELPTNRAELLAVLRGLAQPEQMDTRKSRTSLEMLKTTPSGLDLDAKNLFTGANTHLQYANTTGNFEKLKPLETYEEYLRRRLPSEEAEEIIRMSNPANIRRVNELVDEYNKALPGIKEEKNAQLGLDILNRMNEVFVGGE